MVYTAPLRRSPSNWERDRGVERKEKERKEKERKEIEERERERKEKLETHEKNVKNERKKKFKKKTSSKMVDVGRLPDRGGLRNQHREKEEMKARATHVSPVVSSRWLRKENEKENY